MRARFAREVAAAGLATSGGPGALAVVGDQDLASLPAATQRYLRFMGVIGRPRDWCFRAHMKGHFRTRPDQSWLAMEAWQHDSRPDIARIFHIRVRFFGIIPVLARDTYLNGEGRMLIRPLDLFTVEDVKTTEVATSELVTYLNDAVLLAPSFLLGPDVSWSEVDADSFDVSLTHLGQTVTGRVLLDAGGAPRDFATTDRFLQDPEDPRHAIVRARWTTPIDGWRVVEGRALPTSGRAVWHLPKGDFTYVEMTFAPGDVAFNVPPGQ